MAEATTSPARKSADSASQAARRHWRVLRASMLFAIKRDTSKSEPKTEAKRDLTDDADKASARARRHWKVLRATMLFVVQKRDDKEAPPKADAAEASARARRHWKFLRASMPFEDGDADPRRPTSPRPARALPVAVIVEPPTSPKFRYAALALVAAAVAFGPGLVWPRRASSFLAGVGDGLTSELDASLFFAAMDSDSDGVIEAAELLDFVGGKIGGPVFDSTEEIEAGVNNILKSADADADRQLSSADMRAYWKSLGSLLSVDEVALWVEHAAQLPADVAKRFRAASVSGYDFVELVRDGAALQDVVGVSLPRQRDKLVRAMRMRLTGIGSAPSKPQPFLIIDAPTCTEARFSWGTSFGGGFPVHKYRLERRAKGKKGKDSFEDVADGVVNDLVDETLEAGVSYEYRVSAWNAIGRSPYSTLVVTAKQRASCDAGEVLGSMLVAPIARLVKAAWSLLQIMLYVLVLGCAALRLGHSQQPDEQHPLFARVWAAARYFMRRAKVTRNVLEAFDTALSATPTAAQHKQAETDRHMGRATPALVGTTGQGALPPEMDAAAAAARSLRGEEETGFNASHCLICAKPFVFGFRSKHHCYVCAKPFCKNCGRIRHSHLVTCPLGAQCICHDCGPKRTSSASSVSEMLGIAPADAHRGDEDRAAVSLSMNDLSRADKAESRRPQPLPRSGSF
ncbi:hypothetical protein M885DRAFT_507147 [Pelagophyceae sp. CCMP2097]|nr:hypothetical protein M885DRAFT_507147 [Pelagophyceae sp. CCMP2097]